MKILFIKPSDSSFIRTDQAILEKYHFVKAFLLKQASGKARYLISLIRLSGFFLRYGPGARLFTCWFGDYHAAVMVALARLMGKPTVIFAGGQEAVCYRELGKGVYLKKGRGAFVKYALRNCTLLIPNHTSLIYHENHFYNPGKPHIDGISHYAGAIKGTYEVVPNGIDTARVFRNPEISKDLRLVATIGTMHKKADFYNKGFDLFIEVARRCPDLNFVMIGLKKDLTEWTESLFRVSEIPNLKIIPSFCPLPLLNETLNRAAVYVQASITEGMPVSLGEAMLCECVPVGSNVNGIPDAIGTCGVIIDKRDPRFLEEAVRKALTMNTGKEARAFTLQNFSIESREIRLRDLLERYFAR